MKGITTLNLKNGKTVSVPGLIENLDSSFFKHFEETRNENGTITAFVDEKEIKVNARDVHSVEFILQD